MRRFLPVAVVCTLVCSGAVPLGFAESFVSGLVYEKQGDGFRPIPHARIQARSAGAEGIVGQVEADEFGHYILAGLPEGDLILTASHPRYYPVRGSDSKLDRRVRCPADGSCGQSDFEMIRSGHLEVTVVDESGDPIDDVRVRVRALTEPGRKLDWKLEQRGVRGVFHASTMRPGRYRVRAEPTKPRRDGTYHPVEEEVEFRYGQKNGRLQLVMPFTRSFQVSGMVDGLLRWNALHLLVVLRPQSVDDRGVQAKRLGAALDEDGTFVLNGVPGGIYSVHLAPLEGTTLDASAREVLLGSVRVEDDLSGLAFALPDSQ